MKIIVLTLFFFVLFVGNLRAESETQNSIYWQVTPCSGFGPVQGKTTLADVIRIFGRGNVQDTRIEGAEGETYPGAIVFPGEPLKRLKIIWKDDVKNAVAEASVEGERSVWKTPQGVTLGMKLKELEKLNGKPLTVSGFGWDYGGRVISWNQGALNSAFPKSFGIALTPDPTKTIGQRDSETVTGDKPISSSLPALRALEPRVTEMSCQFP